MSVVPGITWRLDVFDVRGRLVRFMGAGLGTGAELLLLWDGRDDRHRHVANGVYVVRLQSSRAR